MESVGALDPTVVSGRGGQATLLLLADVRGVLRPCGCTPELQKGGFDRLIPVLDAERALSPANLVLHAGPMFHEEFDVHSRKRQQHVRQAEVAGALFELAQVDVAGVHPLDALPDPTAWAELAKRSGAEMLATNVSGLGRGSKRWEIRSVGGLAIGIFALSPETDGVPGWDIRAPQEAAREAVAALSGKSDAIIMLSGLGLRETKRLLRGLDGVDFALVGGMGDHPTVSDEAELVGKSRILQFHREGRYLGRLVLRRAPGDGLPFADGSVASATEIGALELRIARLATQIASLSQTGDATTTDRALVGFRHQHAKLDEELKRLRARHESVPAGRASFSFRLVSLDWDLAQAEAPLAIMNAFDQELAQINVASAGTLPEPLPGQAVYVGVGTCLGCHTEATTFWNANRHSHAWETLERVNKTFDAGCVSCHVTGYEQAGGALVGQVEGREDVQCESCHGPGSKHVADGAASSILRAPTVEACAGCHNQHHSPGFDFDAYRARLLVPGHGRPLGR